MYEKIYFVVVSLKRRFDNTTFFQVVMFDQGWFNADVNVMVGKMSSCRLISIHVSSSNGYLTKPIVLEHCMLLSWGVCVCPILMDMGLHAKMLASGRQPCALWHHTTLYIPQFSPLPLPVSQACDLYPTSLLYTIDVWFKVMYVLNSPMCHCVCPTVTCKGHVCHTYLMHKSCNPLYVIDPQAE